MDYYKYEITCQPNFSEILMALFSEVPFDTFEEHETGFNAYIPIKEDFSVVQDLIHQLKEQFDFQINKQYIKAQNWNKKWESNFQPIQIGDFCGIRADFHPDFDNVQYQVNINPKMAFGTGHHATTFLVIQIMKSLSFEKKKVLDYGCGTGVLAILGSMLGATHIDAVDIEEPSFENTIENCEINNVNNVQTYHGTLASVVDNGYDIILANINRNVILKSLKELYTKLNVGGVLVISGFVTEDKDLMQEACEQEKFVIQKIKERNNWLCFQIQK